MSQPVGYLLPGRTGVDRIVAEVARGFDVSVEELRGSSRARQLVIARACAMAVVREATDWSLPQIGRYFGRDHTTAMHHIHRVMADPDLAQGVALVVQELSMSESESSGKAGHTVDSKDPGVRKHPGRGRHPEEVPAMPDGSRAFRREEAV